MPSSAPAGKTQQLTAPDQVPDGLAKSDWHSIRAAYEAGRHAFQPVEGGWQARNPGQQWTTRFDRRGFVAEPKGGGWQWGLELTGYGFPGAVRDIRGVPAVKADGPRLTYDWDATVQEWWLNDARGLEHGFTVKERPRREAPRSSRGDEAPISSGKVSQSLLTSAATDQDLSFTLAVRGSLAARVAADGLGVEFRDAAGATVLTYAGLKVWDADGKILPSRFELSDSQLSTLHPQPTVRLLVDERGARYPLTIDPIAQQAYLKASSTGASDQFGDSVAVSGDTVVVGAIGEDSGTTGVNSLPDESADAAGAAYLFTIFCAPNLTATSTNDSGPGSLRLALLDVCPGGTIDFAPALNGQTIGLTSGELVINQSLTLLGPGAANLAISGNASSRVFYISNGVTWTLAGLAITQGNGAGAITSGFGGGILNQGDLTVSNFTLSGNSSFIAGGIWNFGNFAATLTVQNSTLSGNSATAGGGGLYASGTEQLTNCIVAGNFTGSGTTPSDIGGPGVDSAAYNLIGDAATAGGLTHGVNGNLVGNAGVGTLAITSILNTNLAFNGGPTTRGQQGVRPKH